MRISTFITMTCSSINNSTGNNVIRIITLLIIIFYQISVLKLLVMLNYEDGMKLNDDLFINMIKTKYNIEGISILFLCYLLSFVVFLICISNGLFCIIHQVELILPTFFSNLNHEILTSTVKLVYKWHSGELLKKYPLWAAVLKMQVKIICTIHYNNGVFYKGAL